jgi:two-component system CheB/CheR fusion protein
LGEGYLFLGRAETVFSHPDLFIPVSVPLRIFSGVPVSPRRDELMVHDGERPGPVEPDSSPLAALAMASTPVAQLVVDVDGRLSSANTKARALFGITRDNLGQRFRDLEVSYRPVELRPLIERAFAESAPVLLHDVPRSRGGGLAQYLEGAVAPWRDAAGVDLGASITFTDVTELGRARRDLDRSTRELRVAVEQLQSANEELETTNEELQSANEELETMNEELQSSNEELDAMNREFLRQSVEIEAAEQLLDGVLDGLSVGAAVLDDSLDVRLWNRTMEQLWGVERDDARDRSILALDIGFPVREIADSLHTIAGTGGDEAREFRLDGIDAVDHRGRALSCRVAIRRVREPDEGEGRIAVLIDVRPVSVP